MSRVSTENEKFFIDNHISLVVEVGIRMKYFNILL